MYNSLPLCHRRRTTFLKIALRRTIYRAHRGASKFAYVILSVLPAPSYFAVRLPSVSFLGSATKISSDGTLRTGPLESSLIPRWETLPAGRAADMPRQIIGAPKAVIRANSFAAAESVG